MQSQSRPHLKFPALLKAIRKHRASCAVCGAVFFAHRRSAIYCGGKCRKQAQRQTAVPVEATDDDCRQSQSWADYQSGLVVHILSQLKLIGRVGPCRCNDPSPPTYALMVPRRVALASVNLAIVWADDVTDAELVRILDDRDILQKTQPLPARGTKTAPRVSQVGKTRFDPELSLEEVKKLNKINKTNGPKTAEKPTEQQHGGYSDAR